MSGFTITGITDVKVCDRKSGKLIGESKQGKQGREEKMKVTIKTKRCDGTSTRLAKEVLNNIEKRVPALLIQPHKGRVDCSKLDIQNESIYAINPKCLNEAVKLPQEILTRKVKEGTKVYIDEGVKTEVLLQLISHLGECKAEVVEVVVSDYSKGEIVDWNKEFESMLFGEKL